MMKYNTTILSNGLRVIHLPSASDVVYCGIAVAAGTRHELPGEEGMAHFCEHATFKGTRRRTALQILNTLERVGGELNAFTNKEDTVFYAAVLRRHLPRAIDLLTDIVFGSTYPDTEVERERDIICDEIESYNDSPAELIYDLFENQVFSGHPLGHNILGTREQVSTYTAADIRRFAQRHYRPERAVLFVYGGERFDAQRQVHLPDTTATAAASHNADTQPHTADTQTTTALTEKYHQAHVMLGCRTFGYDDKRRLPLFLLNNILGGPGMNARLNLSLRERHGLVYTVESSMACYGDTGVWATYFGCDHEDVKRCLQLVHRELDRLTQHPLSQRQLNAAKRQICGQLAIACDNREQFAIDFARSYLHYGRERQLDELRAQIEAISSAELLDTAQYVFAPERLQLLTL